jgi:SpoVK/Ycf46/Vps4 family AAA+-type ATPase
MFFLGLMNETEKKELIHSLLIPNFNTMEKENEHRGRYPSDLNVINNPDELDPSHLADDLETFGRHVRNGKRLISNYLKNKLLKNVSPNEKITLTSSKFQNIINLLKLNEEEVEYLKFSYFLSIYPYFENLLNFSSSDVESLQRRASLLRLPVSKVRNLVDEESRLESFGLLDGISGRYRSTERLTSSFQSYLEGEGYNGFAEKYIRIDTSKSFTLGSFPKKQSDQEIVIELLQSNEPCKILFYGKPGTGKTEYARALLRSQSRDFILVEADKENSNRSERKISLLMAEKMAVETGRPILVDEAEIILNTQKDSSGFFLFGNAREEKDNPQKQWVNEFLESSKSKIIFIVNSIGGIHESTRRRFDYSISFPGFTQLERLHHWDHALSTSRLKSYISPINRKNLSKEFDLSAGGISSAIATTEKVYSRRKKLKEEEILSTIRNLLEKHQTFVTRTFKNNVIKTVSQFNPSILNTDTNRDVFEKSVLEYYQEIEMNSKSIEGSICALFHGKPGTGKTEYAKYLSEKLDRDIIVKSASSFLDMYVGNTEKFIRETFAEAERSKSILFIDEADTLLGSRENATRSWEISHTNELLTCMENHKILFIASTNLLDSFDSAAIRRFHWKIRFSPLLPEDKWKLFQEYFSTHISNSTDHLSIKNRVMNIPELCPGDFRAIYNQLQFNKDQLDPIKIIELLENEVSYKKGVHLTMIGFKE